MLEVELKFAVVDAGPIVAGILACGAQPQPPLQQVDLYFNHPQRDFGQTDEALRVRRVGTQNVITYKGPVLDSQTKTRRELEIPLGEGIATADQMGEMLRSLGFQPVREVHKQRTPYHLTWENRPFEFSVDEVEELGTYVEIETLADETQREPAKQAVLALAARLNLHAQERKSYLCLLLEKDSRNS